MRSVTNGHSTENGFGIISRPGLSFLWKNSAVTGTGVHQ